MVTKILVVDDEPDIASSVKKGLERNEFQVDAYTDPQKALSEFKPGVYDLLILDIKMPKINGFQLYRKIIKCDDRVKVCFLTAFEEYREEFNKAFPELDEHRFIKKPTTINQLKSRLLQELAI